MIAINYISSLLLLTIFSLVFQASYPDYLPQVGVPTTTQNFISPEDGCNWLGVAGQVFGEDGTPLNGRIIEIRGNVEGESIMLATTTGSSQQMGPGGFDLQLSDLHRSAQPGAGDRDRRDTARQRDRDLGAGSLG